MTSPSWLTSTRVLSIRYSCPTSLLANAQAYLRIYNLCGQREKKEGEEKRKGHALMVDDDLTLFKCLHW